MQGINFSYPANFDELLEISKLCPFINKDNSITWKLVIVIDDKSYPECISHAEWKALTSVDTGSSVLYSQTSYTVQSDYCPDVNHNNLAWPILTAYVVTLLFIAAMSKILKKSV